MSDITTSACPPSQSRTAASAPSSRKSSSMQLGPGDRVDHLQVDRRAPGPTGLPRFSPSALTRATATWVQPPGAAPRSTTRAPGFRKPNLSSSSMIL